MKKRKINPEYLRNITSGETKNEAIDSLDFALSVKRFADEYLEGILSVSIAGQSEGTLSLKLPVVPYLIRLMSESSDDGRVTVNILLGEMVTMHAQFDPMPSINDTVHMINVARLAGFEIIRDGNTLSFSAEAKSSHILKIYAVSSNDFADLLALTYKM